MSPRSLAAVTLAALAVAAVVIVVARVPLSAPPAPRSDQLAALGSFPADTVAKGRAFHAALRPGSYGAMALSVLIAVLLGMTPMGKSLVDLVSRPFGGHWLARALLGGLAVVFVSELATLPIAAWQHTIMRRYALSTQDWGAWGVDVLKNYGVGAVIGAVALGGFFTITRLAPRWWWAPAAACAAMLVVIVSFAYPVLVEPVFNRFTPMEQGQLRDDLMTMARRDGVPVRDVLVADASRRTRTVNAYVSGIGPTRRIVVYDTLMKEARSAEIVSVVAHELGHAKDQDVVVGTLLGALGASAAVIALYLVGSWGWLLRRAGVDSIAQPQAIALVVALITIMGLVAGPAQALVSRRIEARADAHALELTGDAQTFIEMQEKLSTVNLSDPDPPVLEHNLFGSHPTTVERMAAAMAWARGER